MLVQKTWLLRTCRAFPSCSTPSLRSSGEAACSAAFAIGTD